MTITFHPYPKEDIFDSGCEYLVNPVNCVGHAGAGLAAEFKHRFPLWNNAYEEACKRGFLRPGHILIYDYETPYIINFPTKDHWRNPSKKEWIAQGMATMVGVLQSLPASSIAIPMLGAGLGGLDEEIVKTIILVSAQQLLGWEVKIYGKQ